MSESNNFRGLGLSLPGMPGAPAVGGHPCLVHRAVTQVLGSGKGGATELDADCLAHVQCMERVDRYIALGLRELAVQQLEACGGVPASALPPPACESDDRLREEVIACRIREAGDPSTSAK